MKGNEGKEHLLDGRAAVPDASGGAAELCVEMTAKQLAEKPYRLPMIDELVEAGRIGPPEARRLMLAFQEALTNSLDHGSLDMDSAWKEEITDDGVDKYTIMKKLRLLDRSYADRKLRITLKVSKTQVVIQIMDEGRGFLPQDKVMKIDADSDILCHGRGIALISQCVDETYYSLNGRVITLVKNLRA